jgi:hypothetical protein
MSIPSPSSPVSSRWPAGPLDAAQRGFDLLTDQPAPLAFDCRPIDGLPDRVIALDELRKLLIRGQTSRSTQDAVWAELVTRARRDGPAWVITAVGIALPGLRRRAGLLARGWQGESADLDSELLLGFLERLGTIDVEAGNICSRLIEAGARTVQRSRRHSERTDAISTGRAGSLPPARPWDHPDFVLARALASAVIGPEECFLIGETRLGDMSLQAGAQRLGVATATAASWRRRGEAALHQAIQEGELVWVRLGPRESAGSAPG